MRIAFAGNPNSGKTTMYNALSRAEMSMSATGRELQWSERKAR